MNADGGWAGKLMGWMRIVSALIVVNLLIVAGSLVGLVLFGTLPALAAATTCLRRLRDGDPDEPVAGGGLVRLFIAEYRRRFVRANLLGLLPVAVLALAAADTAILPALPGPVSAAVAVVTWVAAAFAVVVLAAVLTIDDRYDDAAGATLRYAAVLPLTSPAMTGALLLSLAVMAAALMLLPMLVPLIGISVPLFVAGWFVDHRLAQLDPTHPRAQALAAAH